MDIDYRELLPVSATCEHLMVPFVIDELGNGKIRVSASCRSCTATGVGTFNKQ